MTKLHALSLIGQGLKSLMDSERPCRDSLVAIEYTLDGTVDDCELAVDFIEEIEDQAGRIEKTRTCFMVTAEEIEDEETE
jgi:hypothetical protein